MAEHNKPSRKEHALRVNEVINLLRGRVTKQNIRKYMYSNHGIGARTLERYLKRAREVLTAETGRPKQEHVVDAYAFYSNIVGDITQPMPLRMNAQEALVKLLGLAVPFRVAQTDTAGNDAPTSPDGIRAELAALISEVRQLNGPG